MSLREEAKPEKRRSEEELRLSCWMALAQKGDSESYRKLLAELNTMLEKYAVRAVKRSNPNGDTAIARDIVQEVLLAIHNKRHTYDSTQRFLPWVFGIARHKLIDWQRKHFSEKRTLDFEFDLEDIASPDDPLSSMLLPDGKLSDELNSFLGKLNPKQREVIELTKIQGLTVAETAERTGLSEANVKVLTHRGIVILRKMMVEQQHE